MADTQKHRRFSMVRELQAADLLTLLNGVAGMGAILALLHFCSEGDMRSFWLGVALLPVALAMDVLDGRVARMQRRASDMGRELDSLADIVSFGVAPAVLGYAVGLDGGWDALCLVVFVAAGISRLARYNVTSVSLSDAKGKVKYYEGLPIPSSLLIAALLVALAASGRWHDDLPLAALQLGPAVLHPLALVYVVHAAGMVSKTLRIPKP